MFSVKAVISRIISSVEFGVDRAAVAAFISIYRREFPTSDCIVGTISIDRFNKIPAPRSEIIRTVPASCGIGGVVISAIIGRRQASASKVVKPPSFEIITFADCISFSISSEYPITLTGNLACLAISTASCEDLHFPARKIA